MPRIARSLLFVFGLLLASAPAHAQATRTWVSGLGDDANPCSRTAPCKTFAGAISKTAAGGEIDALDPGGFGTLTITKSITIDGGGGQVASILASGTNGINVNAGPDDAIILKNLSINGGGTTLGLNGVNFLAGATLTIDNVEIFNFSQSGLNIGLSGTGMTVLRNSTFRGILGNAVNASTTSGVAVLTVVNSSFQGVNNGAGTLNSGGVLSSANSIVAVSGSDFSNFQVALAALNNGNLTVDRSLIMRSVTGINTGAGSATNLTNNTFVQNVNALAVAGTVASANNNTIVGATGNPNATLPPK
jgi:hypothetical protein